MISVMTFIFTSKKRQNNSKQYPLVSSFMKLNFVAIIRHNKLHARASVIDISKKK